MKSTADLQAILSRIDGKGYKAYRDLRGVYRFPDYELHIDYVQADPFAPPSSVMAKVPQQVAEFSPGSYRTRSRKIALEDFLTRSFYANASKLRQRGRGSGNSGLIAGTRCSQNILERSAIEVNEDSVQARFWVGLPGAGRRVSSNQAADMFFRELPSIVRRSLLYSNLDSEAMRTHIEAAEDADYLRSSLEEKGIVAFIANDSVLPRRSGVDDRPLEDKVIPFLSPPSLEVTFDCPNRGKITGMGIPEGIALIVGGGYHGKSTLLDALAYGVYDKIPGDGREFVVTIEDAVFVRSEDGRYIEKVDISPFVSNLPNGQSTTSFSTPNASGSTSQAANIMEALEMGASCLLIDEDTSATNFMIRDERMQALVDKAKEPITPLIDQIRLLYRDLGVSTVLVMGGSGDYFEAADTIILMDSYEARDVANRAKEIARLHRTTRRHEGRQHFEKAKERIPQPESLKPWREGKVRIRPKGVDEIVFGQQDIDLSCVEQLVEEAQSRSIGELLHYAANHIFDGKTNLRQGLDTLEKALEKGQLGSLVAFPSGGYARPRKYEIAAALNRLRTLRCI